MPQTLLSLPLCTALGYNVRSTQKGEPIRLKSFYWPPIALRRTAKLPNPVYVCSSMRPETFLPVLLSHAFPVWKLPSLFLKREVPSSLNCSLPVHSQDRPFVFMLYSTVIFYKPRRINTVTNTFPWSNPRNFFYKQSLPRTLHMTFLGQSVATESCQTSYMLECDWPCSSVLSHNALVLSKIYLPL